MGLTMLKGHGMPEDAEMKRLGFGSLQQQPGNLLRVMICAVIDGGPITQQEHRDIGSIVDNCVFDLRRRGNDWAANAYVLVVSFPDTETFMRSVAGERNLKRTAKFPLRQKD